MIMGYLPPSPPSDGQDSQELRIGEEVDLDQVVQVAGDLLILQCDLELLRGNAKAISSESRSLPPVRIADILKARNAVKQTYTDTYNAAIGLAMERAARQPGGVQIHHLVPRGVQGPPPYSADLGHVMQHTAPPPLSPGRGSGGLRYGGGEGQGVTNQRGSRTEPYSGYMAQAESDNQMRQGSGPTYPSNDNLQGGGGGWDDPRREFLPVLGSGGDMIRRGSAPLLDLKGRDSEQQFLSRASDNAPYHYENRLNQGGSRTPHGAHRSDRDNGQSRLSSMPEEVPSRGVVELSPSNPQFMVGEGSPPEHYEEGAEEELTNSMMISYSGNMPRPNPDDLPEPVFVDEAALTANIPTLPLHHTPLRHSSSDLSCGESRVGLFVNARSTDLDESLPVEAFSPLESGCGGQRVMGMGAGSGEGMVGGLGQLARSGVGGREGLAKDGGGGGGGGILAMTVDAGTLQGEAKYRGVSTTSSSDARGVQAGGLLPPQGTMPQADTYTQGPRSDLSAVSRVAADGEEYQKPLTVPLLSRDRDRESSPHSSPQRQQSRGSCSSPGRQQSRGEPYLQSTPQSKGEPTLHSTPQSKGGPTLHSSPGRQRMKDEPCKEGPSPHSSPSRQQSMGEPGLHSKGGLKRGGEKFVEKDENGFVVVSAMHEVESQQKRERADHISGRTRESYVRKVKGNDKLAAGKESPSAKQKTESRKELECSETNLDYSGSQFNASHTWTCDYCTFLNVNTETVCEVCGIPGKR